MNIERVNQFAILNGYYGAEPLGKWRGYDIYEPIMSPNKDGDISHIGLPLLIMVRGDLIRMSSPEEGLAQLDDVPDDFKE